MRLVGYKEIRGIIHCKTGLRIGGSNDNLEIGGIDSPIIRHPITDLPYIPGSSLKGKMRTLLELKTGNVDQEKGQPHNCGRCEVCVNFGSFKSTSPTRFIFRDCLITDQSAEWLRSTQEQKGFGMTEEKKEVAIDRRTGRALNGSLRTLERVPAGTEFEFAMSIRIFEGDNEQHTIELVRKAIDLLEKDYLGGSGSRGYGQVEFKNMTIDGKPLR